MEYNIFYSILVGLNYQTAELIGLWNNTFRDINNKQFRDKYTICDTKSIKSENKSELVGLDNCRLQYTFLCNSFFTLDDIIDKVAFEVWKNEGEIIHVRRG